ncbi:FG-GAP-like repeat-containing protein [Schumannella sp. 10F1B-5-1]|uniref:FG-GAP-like repeat-containing protein n=1 Tax=Schumannella sp. 10F1B-5-1 TaxID=2590780 RepID=UPI0011303C93|nr:FG-GAP-like repeat-containing protein [Schumannella sp. 10F1B-5-1]TPW70938.1 hypothetical protein FJ658_12615 [Schumannella sp. 10F1B-5-1]
MPPTSGPVSSRTLRLSIIALSAAVALASTVAQPARAAAPGSVTGMISFVDPTTQQTRPAVGVTIALEKPNALGQAVASQVSDDDGGFEFTGVEAGDYVLSAHDLRSGPGSTGITRQYYQYSARPETAIRVPDGGTYTVQSWQAFRGAALTVGVASACDSPTATTTAQLQVSPQFPPFGFSIIEPVTPPAIGGGVISFTGLHANGEAYMVRVQTVGRRGVCSRVLGPYYLKAGEARDIDSPALRKVGGGIDFDGDAKSDVVVRTSGGDLINYRGNGGAGWLQTQQIGYGGWNNMNLVFNATGFGAIGEPDVLGRDAAGNLYLYRGYGMPGTTWSRTNELVGRGWNVMTAVFSPGDFDGDGVADVLARDVSGNLWLYPGDGSGGFKSRSLAGAGWNIFDSILAGDDYNGDGDVDVLARTRSGALFAYYGDGAGGWTNARGVQVGSGWNIFDAIINAGDFDGDGFADVLARDAGNGNLVMYRSNARGGWIAGGTGRVVGWGWGGLTFLD